MYATHLVFATLVAAIASDGSEETSSNGSPVDAWRTVTLPGAFYLMYRSFKNDDGFGGTGKCVSIELSETNNTTKTAKSKVNYWDAEKTKWTNKTVRIAMGPSDGSTANDIIQIGDAEGPDTSTTQEVRFVYSDYGTCDVTVILGKEKKCELWVKDGYQQHIEVNKDAVDSRDEASVKKTIAKCNEEYNKQCPDQHKYEIYDTPTCK